MKPPRIDPLSAETPFLSTLALLLLLSWVSPAPAADVPATTPPPGWHLVWSDEFNQPDGSRPDPATWKFDIGGNGWGNNELEFYTDRTNNARVEDGKLVIEARQEEFGRRQYTSARLVTLGRRSWTYRRFEARIKIPRGQGIWSAFWIMGTNITTKGWPVCGEIDIMENRGKEPGLIHGTVHGPGYSGGKGIGHPASLPGSANISDDFHIFAVECETNSIRWFFDDKQYFSVTPANLPPKTRWVFDTPKFIILNLAVGGQWPGNPDDSTTFPQRMIVDYVRVYERDDAR